MSRLYLAVFGVLVLILLSAQPVYALLDLGPATAEVVEGKTVVTPGNIITGNLAPVSATYKTVITIPQDEGYFLRLSQGGVPLANKTFDFSAIVGSGWSAWQPFRNNGVPLASDGNGVIKIDYADWKKISLGVMTAKFRVSGTATETNAVSVTTVAADPEKYFRYYQPGNYWIFRGCRSYTQTQVSTLPGRTCPSPDSQYEVRWNGEEVQLPSFSRDGATYSMSSVPLRETNTANTPTSQTGGFTNYTTFLSNNYVPFGGRVSRWTLESIFYTRGGVPGSTAYNVNDLHQLDKVQTRTAVFWPIAGQPNLPYYYISQPMDLTAVPEYFFNTFGIIGSTFVTGTLPSNVYPTKTGWRTDYRMVNVDWPKYRGRALRIRFWEYDAAAGVSSFLNSTGWNYDEWFFAQTIGFLGINNKIGRGLLCSTDPDCRNDTVIMQTPSYSVSLSDSMHLNGQPFKLNVALSPGVTLISFKVALDPGAGPYYLFLTNSDGKPYTGPAEVSGSFTSSAGAVSPLPRQVFRDINGVPVWFENGKGVVGTGANQAIGAYKFQVKPLIFSSTRTLGDNPQPPSNFVEVDYIRGPFPGDLNGDGRVNILDLRKFVPAFPQAYSLYDLNTTVANFGR